MFVSDDIWKNQNQFVTPKVGIGCTNSSLIYGGHDVFSNHQFRKTHDLWREKAITSDSFFVFRIIIGNQPLIYQRECNLEDNSSVILYYLQICQWLTQNFDKLWINIPYHLS